MHLKTDKAKSVFMVFQQDKNLIQRKLRINKAKLKLTKNNSILTAAALCVYLDDFGRGCDINSTNIFVLFVSL